MNDIYLNIHDGYITNDEFNIDTYIADDKWGTIRNLMDNNQSTCLNCSKSSQIDEILIDSISKVYDHLMIDVDSASEDELVSSILINDNNVIKEPIIFNS
jgi:hypothetical protein